MLYVHNTSRVEGEPYGDLLRQKNFRGFPTLAFMDAEGNVLTSQVERSVDGFKRVQTALAAAADLEAKANAGKLSDAEKAKWFVTRLDLGRLDFAAAQTEYASIEAKLSADQKAELSGRIVDMELTATMTKLATEMRGAPPAEREEAMAAKLMEMLEAKRIPSDKNGWRFWGPIMRAAQRKNDDALAARAKTELEAIATRDPSQKAMIDRILNPPQRGGETVRPAVIRRGDGGR